MYFDPASIFTSHQKRRCMCSLCSSRPGNDFFNETSIFFLKTLSLEMFAKFFLSLFQLIFLLSGDHFWFTAAVRRCPDSEKKEIKWLLMAAPRIFRVGRAFLLF